MRNMFKIKGEKYENCLFINLKEFNGAYNALSINKIKSSKMTLKVISKSLEKQVKNNFKEYLFF